MRSPEEVAVGPEPATPGVSERLRAAREARGMSVGEVAQTLKFSPRQIELVEAGAWSSLPGQTFIRGCVRSYARLLGLDAEPLLRDLEAADLPKAAELQVPGSTRATLPQAGQTRRKEVAPVVGGLMLVVFAVIAYFVVPVDFWRRESTIVVQRSATAPAAVPAGAAENPAPAASAAPAATDAAAVGIAASVRFHFDQSSWVEVRDAGGNLLLSQNNAAGSVQEVSGPIPLAIVVGDARRVRMVYKDKPVDLAPFTNPQSNVARLNIE